MPDRQETAAWRLMGDAFVRLLRSERADPSARARASLLAEWLHASMLTADQQHQFMIGTGWVLDPATWAELQAIPHVAIGELDDEIPF